MKKLTRYLLLGIVALLCSGYAWADPVTVNFYSSPPAGMPGATGWENPPLLNYGPGTWNVTMTATATTSDGYSFVLTTAPGSFVITQSTDSSGITSRGLDGSFGAGGSWLLYQSGQLVSSGFVSSAHVAGTATLYPLNTFWVQNLTALLGGANASGDMQISIGEYPTMPTSSYVYGHVQYETASPVPEPASIALLGSGVLALGRTVKRRLAANKQPAQLG